MCVCGGGGGGGGRLLRRRHVSISPVSSLSFIFSFSLSYFCLSSPLLALMPLFSFSLGNNTK